MHKERLQFWGLFYFCEVPPGAVPNKHFVSARFQEPSILAPAVAPYACSPRVWVAQSSTQPLWATASVAHPRIQIILSGLKSHLSRSRCHLLNVKAAAARLNRVVFKFKITQHDATRLCHFACKELGVTMGYLI